MVTRGLKERTYLNYRPSVVAACALYLERMNVGQTPFWPQALQHMTSYSHVNTPELSAAIQCAKGWVNVPGTAAGTAPAATLPSPALISALYGSIQYNGMGQDALLQARPGA